MRRFFHMLLPMALAACSPATAPRIDTSVPITWSGPQKSVLLVQPDVELNEVTLPDAVRPRADWTAAATGLVRKHVAAALKARGIATIAMPTAADRRESQLVRLNAAVIGAMRLHLNISNLRLPNKNENMDWTLGPGVAVLRRHYGGDYALFLHLRDAYSTDGHKALTAAAALLLVPVTGGIQRGSASLVDLRTGRVVWFNVLSSLTGDLREDAPAADAVSQLLAGLPL